MVLEAMSDLLKFKLNYLFILYKYKWKLIKIITNKIENNIVIGFHILSPNAGEITQVF